MKRVFFGSALFFLIFGFCAISDAAAQALKVGVYDSNRVLRESKTIEGYNKELSKSIEAKRVPLTQKEEAVKALAEKLRKDGQSMSAGDRKVLEEKLVNEDKDLKRLREDVELELRRVQAELRQKALVDINAAIKRIGDKENYTIIFEKTNAGIVYLKEKDPIDITDKIISQMK
jgi:outer membrane protein